VTIAVPSLSATAFDVTRIGLGLVVVLKFSKIEFFRPDGKATSPVGLARVVDLRRLSSRRAARWIQYVVYVATLCYVSGRLAVVALPVLALATIVEATLRSSYGSVNHDFHLLAIVLVAETGAIMLWNASTRFGWQLDRVLADSQRATVWWWSVQAIIAVYFTSGLTKLINTRGRWIFRSPGLLLSARGLMDIDRLMGVERGGGSGRSGYVAQALLRRLSFARCVFAVGLITELASPLGLLGPAALALVGIALIALHVANWQLLALSFWDYQLLVVAFLVLPQVLH
jgi:hypothetical protein